MVKMVNFTCEFYYNKKRMDTGPVYLQAVTVALPVG